MLLDHSMLFSTMLAQPLVMETAKCLASTEMVVSPALV